MNKRPRIYLAGPTVFMPDRAERGAALKAMCEAQGCEGLYALDADMGHRPHARRIMIKCLAMIEAAQAVVADLSPFRGPHVDDGTAFEVGFAVARGIPVFGYSTDLRTLADRIAPRSASERADVFGIAIEDLGQPFNAMIAGALAEPAFGSPRDAIAAAARHLQADPGV